VRAGFEALIDAWQEARAPLTTAQSWSQCRAETEVGSETTLPGTART
jgi:hypothetical protein